MSINIKFRKDKGWKNMAKALGARYSASVMDGHVNRATKLNGLYVLAKVRESIVKSEYAPNAPLTIMIKRSTKPLIGYAAGAPLFTSLTSVMANATTAFVGVLRTSAEYNIGVILHYGVAIKITEKMRNMFRLLWQASKGDVSPSALTGRAKELFDRVKVGWLPLNPNKREIIIPPRPFIDNVFSKKPVRDYVHRQWATAVNKAFAMMSGK